MHEADKSNHQALRDELGDTHLYETAAGTQAHFSVIRTHASRLSQDAYNLVKSRWLRSARYGNDYFKLIAPNAYYDSYGRYICDILARPETRVRIAVVDDARDVILGFSVVRGNVLDYVHVQKDFRERGIAKALVPVDISSITHLTKTALQIWPKTSWVFNPFA